MRSLDNFTFFSLVLLTLCTTKPKPSGPGGEEAATETTVAVRRAPSRAPIRPLHVEAFRRVVLRRPS